MTMLFDADGQLVIDAHRLLRRCKIKPGHKTELTAIGRCKSFKLQDLGCPSLIDF